LVFWILFGLGYIVMIIGIITHGLSSPARKAAKKFAVAEKILFEKIIREIVAKREKVTLLLFFKEVARGGERTRVLSISFIFSFSPLYR
jgi:hypothetical protein